MITPTQRMLDAGYEASHQLAKQNGQGLLFSWTSKADIEKGMAVVYHAMESVRVEDEARAKIAASEASAAAHSIATAPGVAHAGVEAPPTQVSRSGS